MFFKRKKPRFVPVRHISVDQSLRIQVKQECGPQDEDKPMLTSDLLAVKAKYGVVDVPLTEGQLGVVRGHQGIRILPPPLERGAYARAA